MDICCSPLRLELDGSRQVTFALCTGLAGHLNLLCSLASQCSLHHSPGVWCAAPGAVSAAVGTLNVALAGFRDLVKAGHDVREDQQKLQLVQQQLGTAQRLLHDQLLGRRLKSDAATAAVQQLETAIDAALQDLGRLLPAAPPASASWWVRAWTRLRSALCCRVCGRCLAGTSELSRRLAWHEQQLSNAGKAAEAAGVALDKPHTACQSMLAPLQLSCRPVRPAKFEQLKQAVLAQPTNGQLQGPRVVQLLGFPGMGKSVLANMVAEELQKEGEEAFARALHLCRGSKGISNCNRSSFLQQERGGFRLGWAGLYASCRLCRALYLFIKHRVQAYECLLTRRLFAAGCCCACAGAFSGGVYWLRASPKPEYEPGRSSSTDAAAVVAAVELQRSLLQQLGWPELCKDCSTAQQLHDALRLLFSTTLSKRKHLLVLDDVWDFQIFQQLCCPSVSGTILFTARERVLQSDASGVGTLHLGSKCQLSVSTISLQPASADTGTHAAAAALMERLLGCACNDLSKDQQVCATWW